MTSDLLKELAIYLEGLKAGKGDILPLGQAHLDALWIAVKGWQSVESKKKKK